VIDVSDDGFPHPLAALTNPPDPELELPRDEVDAIPTSQIALPFPALPPGIRLLLYTPDQAAVLLAVRPSWLRRAAAEGSIACTYLGKHLRFSDADLHAIVTDNAFGPRPDSEHPCQS